MEVNVVSGDIAAIDAPAIVVEVFEGSNELTGAAAAVDQTLNGALGRLMGDGEIKGKVGEVTTVHTLGLIPPGRVMVVGLGKIDELTVDRVRQITADLIRSAKKLRISRMVSILLGAGKLDPFACAAAVAEGALLGGYTFRTHFSKDETDPPVETFEILEFDPVRAKAIKGSVERGKIAAGATLWARDKANQPANKLTPSDLADAATELAEECGLEIEIFDRHQVRAMGMTAFLGVAQGSDEPPKLVVLRYTGDPESDVPAIGLVGKGVTFDSGGISIKPAANMDQMKGDMGGGAAVIAAMGAIGKLKPKINVTAIVPATENLPSGKAYKPGDVLTAKNGKTIEVLNTDAEGRVILADALVYAVECDLNPIVDVATLTGAISVALGNVCSGIMGTNQELVDELVEAGSQVGERLWQLPLYDDYLDQIKGDSADWKNTGGRGAGSITGALFLRQFVDDRPWVHLDIAGTDYSEKNKGILSKGATGVGARTLLQFVLSRAEG